MLAALQVSAAPVVALMGFGVLVAIVGHATRARWLVVTGLAILFLATAGMLVGGYVAYHDGSDPDSRPEANPDDAHF
jgi:hypothetical protein